MNRTALFITLAIVVALVGGYYVYEKIFVKKQLSPWQLVPADALVVYEKNVCQGCTQELAKSNVTVLFKNLFSFGRPNDSLYNQVLNLAGRSSQLLISAHATKKDDLDFLFYSADSKAIESLAASLIRLKLPVSKRSFAGVNINEVKLGKYKFSFANFENVWVGTYTPFLIEDVIRTLNTSGAASTGAFKKREFASNRDDAGNVYVNLKQIDNLFSLFSSDRIFPFPIGVATSMDAKTDERSVVLNGFSYDSTDANSDYLMTVFKHQSPTSLGLKNLVSNRALAVIAYGVSNGKEFGNDLATFAKQHSKTLRDSLAAIGARSNVQFQDLYSSIKDEIVLNYFETNKGQSVNKILLIESSKPDAWLAAFNKLSMSFTSDTVFKEQYSSYEIRHAPVYKLPEKLLYPLVSGFSENYYTSIGNVIAIADNLESLKNFLDDVNDEDTWGKSVAQNHFLESTLLESNISLYLNTARALKFLSNHLHGKWPEFVRQNQSLIQSIPTSAIQFSHLNQDYYTNILFTCRDFVPDRKTASPAGEKTLVNFERQLTNLYTVKSHVNRSTEILVQDSLNELTLVSTEGKALWKVSLPGKIISDVVQIDFFNNGKLQYFFATDRALHVIDRTGNYVAPFPLQLLNIEIQFVSIVDYDNSKKYRFLVTDKKGRLWMYDKDGQNLEGWTPKETGGPLAFAARHYRIKGKDYVMATRADGNVIVMTRRGETLKNFPVDLGSNPIGDFSLEVGNTLNDTYFILVTRDGFKVKLTVDGKIQAREPLLKTSIRSTFALVNEKSLKSYLIFQQDNKQLTVADESDKKVFETQSSTPNSSEIKYYEFGSGDSFIILSDKAQNLSYVYDSKGNLLTIPPIESAQVEIRPADSDRFLLFFLHDNVLAIQPL